MTESYELQSISRIVGQRQAWTCGSILNRDARISLYASLPMGSTSFGRMRNFDRSTVDTPDQNYDLAQCMTRFSFGGYSSRNPVALKSQSWSYVHTFGPKVGTTNILLAPGHIWIKSPGGSYKATESPRTGPLIVPIWVWVDSKS